MDKIIFGGTVSKQISFALQQNYVPIFRDITLTNNTGREICGVKLRITFEPAFAAPFTADVGDIPPERSAAVSTVNIVLSADYLFGLTEKLVGNVTFEALSGDEVIAVSHENIELLAYDQWTGTAVLPETVAAFITPNHPKVAEIISAASLYLKKWCGDPSFSGYQSHSANMVKMQMAAIYAALQEQNIAYTAPPASYETAQRVRMPDCVIERKSGTCLDLALLFCACLESVDLNPLLFIVKGHAFAGCWLEEETFPDCLQYDLTAITKRTAKGVDAICAVECTDFVAGKNINFEEARLNAENKLNCGDDFRFAIDIKRTRAGGIRPIPSRITENGAFKAADYGKRSSSEITAAPDMIDNVGNIQLNVSGGEVSKIGIWERKLLDLSLRNSLLNFRNTAMTVQILSHDLAVLEDEFAKGREFRVCSAPADDILKEGDGKIFEIENHRSRISAIAEAEMKNHRLRTLLSESELIHAMTGLRRQAKASMEENGVNTVYLALGFLQWYETERSEKPRYAPLVLLPVDISRRIQDKSFSVKLGGDGAQINVTLLEMLRQNYGIDIQGLNKLPEDEHGVNLPFIFATIRQSVMANPRWEVRELAFIGQFSFSRFIMWNDIRSRSDDLMNNKVTAAMITGNSSWEGSGLSITPAELDRDVSPMNMAVPVAADSSQLAAVYAASKGQSFVLHGPPGTGKSQTITNIIADVLYHNKTVLFVAEKAAALEVVHKRLKKIGLAPFCLALHSNKASKRSVLKQLEETLNTGRIKSPEDFAAEAENYARLRSELNTVMEEMHKPRSCGMSVYDAAVMYEKYAKFGGKFVFKRSQVAEISKDTYAKWHGVLEDLAAAGREFGSIGDSPLKCCTLADWSPSIGTAAKDKLDEFAESVLRAESSFGFMRQLTGGGKWNFPIYGALAEIIALADSEGDIVPEIIYGDDWERISALCRQLIAAGGEYTALKSEILTVFAESVASYDSGAALLKWNKVRNKWFIPRHFGCKRLISELNAYGISENPVNAENIMEYYAKLNRLAALKNYFAVSISEDISAIFSGSGVMLNGIYTDWGAVERAVELSERIREKIISMRIAPNEKQILAQSISRYFGTNSAKSQNREIAEKIAADHAALSKCIAELECELHIVPESLSSGENFAKNAVKQAENIISALPKIREWVGINSVCRRLEEIGIGNAAEKFLSGEVDSAQLLFAFDCDLCRSIISLYVAENPVLSKFQGVLFEETIRKFGECTEKFRTLTINELAAKLSAGIPAVGEAAASSETGILQKAIISGGRMMSIRRLFSSIPDLLRKMCPVMLMSPISAAQYIDRDYPKFDFVIFDEASQLPTCEAVGAMSRGENAIIVGDPKQLPPTSFFTSNRIDEECEKEDLESLLDDCLALSMPQEHLLWHYRSRHESLIAYSNMKYYDNKLYTFPSPDDRISKVSMVMVEGCYDKSSSRTNKAEAKAVVAEILRRLEDTELRKQSIGVVTFSMPQQNLIDDMLTDAYRERPELEAMANEQYEPIIIKNLENVQGDERDVIMFSIGYGPDKDGRVSMNFGPLNRDGGWRRLNVAISRARYSMIVFSSITADMIDLSRTRSEGVAGLKGFLTFAERGRNALAISGDRDSESRKGFPEIVAAELRERGYTVECGIGCSGFRIDAAVVDPRDPQRYILAIFCGTKSSFTDNTAQDRHLAQTSILKGLGWNTVNVHILDWIDNKEKAIAKIESMIAEITSSGSVSAKSENSAESADEPVFETEQALSLLQRCENYIPYEVKSYGTAENFNERNLSEIAACVMNILRTEAPINRNVLIKKLASCYDIARVTQNVRAVAEKAAKECSAVITKAGENEFVWLSEQDPAAYNKCRAVYPDGFKRSLDEISPEEISAAVRLIITSQGSMEREDLIRETARLFGFSRVSSAMESAVSLGIREARIRGYIEFTENGRIKNNF